ncbi:MAG: azurin, partial [Pseudomonadota bacterium]
MKRVIVGIGALLVSSVAFAECEIAVDVGDSLEFSVKAIEAPASCKEITINLKHTGTLEAKMMGHNWVLTKEGDFQAVAQAGTSAGFDNNYLPPGDDRVIAATDIIGGGQSTSVTFATEGLTESQYTYFCSFPGHWGLMKGTFALK